MSSDARKYAEEVLGVHKIFAEVREELVKMDDQLTRLDKAQDDKRILEDQYADREVELISEMRGIHPSMSDTRFKSEWKGWERRDAELNKLRRQINVAKSDVQGAEIELELCRVRLRVGCARMEELGGYLNYLAAVMNKAEQSTQN
jgi:chromosome segregation ATPase